MLGIFLLIPLGIIMFGGTIFFFWKIGAFEDKNWYSKEEHDNLLIMIQAAKRLQDEINIALAKAGKGTVAKVEYDMKKIGLK